MRVPGLEILRVVEFKLDAAAALRLCEQRPCKSPLPGDVSIVRFEPALVSDVATARSNDVADAFVRMCSSGESGWLAIDGSGKVIGHCWRLDNRGAGVVQREVAIPVGYSWLHYEWTVPVWRGRGIQPALLSMSLHEALVQPAWSVRGFVTDIAPRNYASQRSSAKVGFVAVSCVTSLRIYRRWFVLRSGPAPEDVTRQAGA